jgi:hypothetical protein
MNRFTQWLINIARYLLAEFFVQVLAFSVFCVAGLAWLYFSTIYAAIAVIIVGIGLGSFMYGLIEKKAKDESK